MRMNKVRISILVFIFFVGYFAPEPNFIYENFWSKAEFWDVLPYTPSYLLYRFLYAVFLTGFIELIIRFVKKYA
jgi:hypothetical protein